MPNTANNLLHFLRYLYLFLILALAASGCLARERTTAPSPDGAPQRLVLALDGIPYDVFVQLQRDGHFRAFRPAARMVSTFPSLSDVSFAAIGGGKIPDGYQNMRFDPVRNRVVGNTVGSLSGKLHPNLDSDSETHSSLHRMVGYMAAYRVALRDMRNIGKSLLASKKETYVAYLEETDAILHVEGREGAVRFLLQLDTYLDQLQAQVIARTGRSLRIDMVSDHGSTMMVGRDVPVEKLLRDCGFQRAQRLADPRDVAYSLAGIIGSVAITASPEHVEDVARCLSVEEGVDLVAVDRGDAVGVLTADGEAEVRLVNTQPETYSYRLLLGDPLGLLQGTGSTEQVFEQASLFDKTRDSARPNPLRRLWRAFHGSVNEPSPIVVSLADGYEAGNRKVRALARIRGRAGTHGSMTRLASLGVFASNWRDVGDVDSWAANLALFPDASADTAVLSVDKSEAPAMPGTAHPEARH